jgi:hypothetical protein
MRVPRPYDFNRFLKIWKWSFLETGLLCVIKSWTLGYVSFTPLTHQAGDFLALDGQIGAVIF